MNRVTTAAEFLSDSLFSRGYVNPYVPVNPEPVRTVLFEYAESLGD